MNFYRLILILPLLGFAPMAMAQMPEESAAAPEGWQMTVDSIKSRAQTLMVENNGLQDENHQLQNELVQLQQAVAQQQRKNEQLSQFLKERHGRTDQQLQIAVLKQDIRTKKPQAHELEAQWEIWKRKLVRQQREQQRVQPRPAPVAPPPVVSVAGDKLAAWRNELESQQKQEAFLVNELDALKKGVNTHHLNVQSIEENNKMLQAHLDELRLKKLEHIKGISESLQPDAHKSKYEELKERKDQLEVDISAYEARLDDLKPSSMLDISMASRKKELVHQMVLADARNNQMRQQIRELREDIEILKDQVSSLQQRLDLSRGQDQIINP